jgi:hypothetical protein
MTGLESLQVAPEKAMHEAVKVRKKLQWIPQDVGNARNVEHLTRKGAGNKWNQPQRKAI